MTAQPRIGNKKLTAVFTSVVMQYAIQNYPHSLAPIQFCSKGNRVSRVSKKKTVTNKMSGKKKKRALGEASI